MAIPNRIIEGIYSSELKAEDYYSTYSKQEIDAALEDLRKSNMEILNKYTPEAMRAAVEAKLNKKPVPKVSQPKRVISPKSFRIISYAAAAVFVAAISIPVGLQSTKATTSQPTERTKGADLPTYQEKALNLYRQEGDTIKTLSNGDKAALGDVIQITYNAGKSDYGIIFSVDGNGNITRHFPNNSWNAEALKHGSDEVPMDFSYELDDAPDFECFVFVTSNQPFDLNDINKKIKNKKDINSLTKFDYLPNKTEAISFVLNK